MGDRYLIEGAMGGMGVVLRARDEKLRRLVAVKVLTSSVLPDATSRARLVAEARAAAALDHPGVIHVYDVGETDDGAVFYVMELVTGRSLRS